MVCQEKYLQFFGHNGKEVKKIEKMAGTVAVCYGRGGLLRYRIDMAAVDPRLHVSAGGHVFCDFGQAGQGLPPDANVAPGTDGGVCHHSVGIAVRLGCQPRLRSLGLPGNAPQFPRTDLPAVFYRLDAHGISGYVALWESGWND